MCGGQGCGYLVFKAGVGGGRSRRTGRCSELRLLRGRRRRPFGDGASCRVGRSLRRSESLVLNFGPLTCPRAPFSGGSGSRRPCGRSPTQPKSEREPGASLRATGVERRRQAAPSCPPEAPRADFRRPKNSHLVGLMFLNLRRTCVSAGRGI